MYVHVYISVHICIYIHIHIYIHIYIYIQRTFALSLYTDRPQASSAGGSSDGGGSRVGGQQEGGNGSSSSGAGGARGSGGVQDVRSARWKLDVSCVRRFGSCEGMAPEVSPPCRSSMVTEVSHHMRSRGLSSTMGRRGRQAGRLGLDRVSTLSHRFATRRRRCLPYVVTEVSHAQGRRRFAGTTPTPCANAPGPVFVRVPARVFVHASRIEYRVKQPVSGSCERMRVCLCRIHDDSVTGVSLCS